VFTLSKKTKALLSAVLGIVLMVVGFSISPLVQLGYIPPFIGAIVGVSLPLAIEEDTAGKVGISELEGLASKVIAILEQSGKLTPKEQLVAEVAGNVMSTLQSSQGTQPSQAKA
jgi:hypothetical protein